MGEWLTIHAELFGILAGIAVVAVVAHAVTWAILAHAARRVGSRRGQWMLKHFRAPSLLTLVLAAALLATPALRAPAGTYLVVRHILAVGVIAGVFWWLARGLRAMRDAVLERYRLGDPDNLQARRMYTQWSLLDRVAQAILAVLALGTILMTFERVRQVGASILASAGILGIVLGVAAQRTLANVIAGIQIAFTQPLRIDDVVIVEGEWGRIEEINLTYVVVRIWDLRRLIVPITHFIETPFQNWTRMNAELLGTVFFYVDYRAPIEPIRQELGRILEGSAYWDHKVWNLQVTDVTERVVEIRALVSAPDAGTAWNLRAEVREKLMAFLQTHEEMLPKTRVGLSGADDGPDSEGGEEG